MSSRHLIDPELLAALEMFPPRGDMATLLPMIRDGLGALPTPDPETLPATIEERRIATREGHEIGIVILTPKGEARTRPALLHIHGGGYVIGSAAMANATNAGRAAAADCVVVSVDYRLAPETPHPGPLEDCYAALAWLHDDADALRVDRARIAIGGESAGGGLAAALALIARDRGEIPLIHQHLIYPMIDDRTCTAERHPYTGEFVWTPEQNRFGWSSLLGREPGGADVPHYAAAARAPDLAGLPPSFIAVGALDLFLEEDLEYARRLIRAGVPTELHVYPGAYHGFEVFSDAPVAKNANANSLAALKRALHPDRTDAPGDRD